MPNFGHEGEEWGKFRRTHESHEENVLFGSCPTLFQLSQRRPQISLRRKARIPLINLSLPPSLPFPSNTAAGVRLIPVQLANGIKGLGLAWHELK